MNSGRTVFSQLMDFLPDHQFRLCVDRYQGNHKIKSFTCWDQFLCMSFAQLTYRESLRDIQSCLRAVKHKLYHMGFRGNVSRNTLANANRVRDWRIYADFANVLITEARGLYANDTFDVELKNAVYALDSTTIDLCLSLFPWAHFRKRKGAVKLHTLLDLRGNIPTVCIITHGKVSDVTIMDQINYEIGATYIFDRGYTDFTKFYNIHQSTAFFVTRAKRNLQFQRQFSQPVDKETGLRSDQIGVLARANAKKDYPEKLRRIRYYDIEKNKSLTFITNNFKLSASTICDLYRSRWQVELFFKWIKQHLRIKTFYGTSVNAVKTQIWIAISVYVLIAIIKKRLDIDLSLYTILQILSVMLFEKVPIIQALTDHDYNIETTVNCNQLLLL